MRSAARSIDTAEGAGGARASGTAVSSGIAASCGSSMFSVRPRIWGVLNVTPDSFSDGGEHLSPESALERALAMVAAGASVIDVGGESSRPKGVTYGEGATHVPAADELARVLPVVEALVARAVRVSVDTVKAEVAEKVLGAGAAIINDIQGGRSRALLDAVAAAGAEIVLMHNRGRGEVCAPNTDYANVVEDVVSELGEAVERARDAGIAQDRIWVDPGIGFAKTAQQSARLLRDTAALRSLKARVLVGASRKSFIAALAPNADGSAPDPSERLAGSLVAVIEALRGGADAVRVHDVRATHQALRFANALAEVE